MTWEEYMQLYPQPYDLEGFVNQANQQYAGMDYYSRPQEFFDEYDKMRRANMEWQANYNQYSGKAPSNEAMMTNPFLQQSGRALWSAQGTPEYIGSAPETDWYAEAAQGNPVIGASVTPWMTPVQYNQYNPNSPTAVPNNYWDYQGAGGSTPYPQGGYNNLAYEPGGGLPTPTSTGPTDLERLASNLPRGTPTNVTGGGTIGSFWDSSPTQGNMQQGNLGYADVENMFSEWFRNTYGSNYGMGG